MGKRVVHVWELLIIQGTHIMCVVRKTSDVQYQLVTQMFVCFWREGVCGKTLLLQNLHGGAFIIYPGELTLMVRFAVDVEISLKYYRNRFLPKDSLESELILVLLFLSLSLSKLYLVQLH